MDDQTVDWENPEDVTPGNPEAFYLALRGALERLKAFKAEDDEGPQIDPAGEPTLH